MDVSKTSTATSIKVSGPTDVRPGERAEFVVEISANAGNPLAPINLIGPGVIALAVPESADVFYDEIQMRVLPHAVGESRWESFDWRAEESVASKTVVGTVRTALLLGLSFSGVPGASIAEIAATLGDDAHRDLKEHYEGVRGPLLDRNRYDLVVIDWDWSTKRWSLLRGSYSGLGQVKVEITVPVRFPQAPTEDLPIALFLTYQNVATTAGGLTHKQHNAHAWPDLLSGFGLRVQVPDQQSGEVFRDCPECPDMVVVPAGIFLMGSPASEEGRGEYEGPQHRVTISRAFAVGKYEVTFDEWEACGAAAGCVSFLPDHGPFGRTIAEFSWDRGWGRFHRPVINVSWEDAGAYVRWLSRRTGEQYRLLSEAEWEYAARAGTTTPFSTGRTITTDQANFDGTRTYGGSSRGVYREKTLPVGSFPPNAFGLHDMYGNVWEWVEDCWHGSYAGAPGDGSAWTSGGDCHRRVLRGGSWNYVPGFLRSAYRDWYSTDYRDYFFGFRVARTLDR